MLGWLPTPSGSCATNGLSVAPRRSTRASPTPDWRAARRDGRLVRQLRGIDLTAAAARTRDGRVRAVQAVAPHGALSGPTAARLHRWEVPDDWPNEITVAPGTPRPRNRPGLTVVARHLDRGVVERHGLRFTDRARTVAELLRGSALIPQLWLLDQALRGDVPRDAITAHLPAGGYGSATRARRLLSLGDARSESPLESAVALALAAGGVPAPERQLVVRDARGAFGPRRLRLAGPSRAPGGRRSRPPHGPEALARDRTRQNRLVGAGWRPLRTTWAEAVFHPEDLLDAVETALGQHT